jgi:hypothetical protein
MVSTLIWFTRRCAIRSINHLRNSAAAQSAAIRKARRMANADSIIMTVAATLVEWLGSVETALATIALARIAAADGSDDVV